METVEIQNAGQRAVKSVAFSPDGTLLVSVGADNENTVTVWDWKTKTKLASEKGDTNKICQVRWNNVITDQFVTVGEKHCFSWKFANKKLTKNRMLLGTAPMDTFVSVAFSDKGYACCGSQSGSLYVFVDGACKKTFPLHKGTIYSVDYTPGGMVSGGRDGAVIVCDKKVTPVNKFSFPGQVRSISVLGPNLIVGLHTGQIYVVNNFETSKDIGPALVYGHFDGELWTGEWGPDGSTFVTAGEDNMLVVWDANKRTMLRQSTICGEDIRGDPLKRPPAKKINTKAASTTAYPPEQCARALSVSPDGQHVAVGTNAGHLIVYDFKTLKALFDVDLNSFGKRQVQNQTENWIQALKYSPDGKILAVGTHGMVVCLCDPKDGYNVKGTLGAHQAAITHLDWSKDSRRLQTNCLAYELLFHDVDTANPKASKQNPNPKQLRDIEWNTRTCVLQWGVVGVIDPDMGGSDVNAADVSPDKTLVVCGDDFGNVSLFRYPVVAKKVDRVRGKGHSSNVMCTRFSKDGKRVLSVGGNDKAIFQWRIV